MSANNSFVPANLSKLVLFIFLFFVNVLSAQVKLDSDQLEKDYKVLTRIISELSPTLSKTQKESLLDYLQNRGDELKGQNKTPIEFFRFLMGSKPSGAADGHGNINLPSNVVEEVLGDGKVLFPVPIVIHNHQLLVNIENSDIPFGSIITGINGISVESILKQILRSGTTFEIRNLEASFDVLFLLNYGAVNTFKVLYKLPNQTYESTTELQAIDTEMRAQVYKNVVIPLQREKLRKTINTHYFEAEDTFYLQLNSFTWRDDEVSNEIDVFKNNFEEIFKTLQKQNISNLIIDLRFNRGGNMVVPSLLFSYLALKRFNEHIELRVPNFDFPEPDYLVGIENRNLKPEEINQQINNFKKAFTKQQDYYEVKVVNQKTIKPNNKAFQGNVYVLVGGRTFSAAAYFAALFKSEGRGQILGEAIGGTFRDITAGMQLVYELPNSKLLVNMPIGLYKLSGDLDLSMPDAKINSDMIIPEDLYYQYFLNKKDAYLEETLKYISKGN